MRVVSRRNRVREIKFRFRRFEVDGCKKWSPPPDLLFGIFANSIIPSGSARQGQLMLVHLAKGVAHVVEVHTDVPESGLDVLMAVELRNRLNRGPRVIEVATERPSESVVAEVHLKAVADLVDHRTIQAVTPPGVGPSSGLVDIMTPNQQVVRDRPGGIVRPDSRDYLGTLLQPGPEDPLAVRMEGDGPPLPLPTTLAAERDGALARVIAEVDVTHMEFDDFGDA